MRSSSTGSRPTPTDPSRACRSRVDRCAPSRRAPPASASTSTSGGGSGWPSSDRALDALIGRFWEDEHGLVADAWDPVAGRLDPYRGVNANMHTVEVWAYASVLHPTYPESASRSGTITKKDAFARLFASWDTALDEFSAAPITPDAARPLAHYGDVLTDDDLAPIGEAGLPPGLPVWMRSLDAWAARRGDTPDLKRATIAVTVPTRFRPPAVPS